MRSHVLPLVTAAWLKDAIANKQPNLQVLDATWHMPPAVKGGDAPKEFAKKHIPTAQFFQTELYIAELPTPGQFGEDIGKLGVENDTHVVLYDNNSTFGMFSAPRAWWLLRYYGHENVSILDGGFPKWQEAGNETTAVVDKIEPKSFKAIPNAAFLRTIEDIEANIEKKQFTLIDARPAGRFLGTAPEPRPDVKPGHIKGSVNIHFILLIDPNTKQMKSAEAIREVFKDASVDLDNSPIVTTCGGGVAACFTILAAYICGKQEVALYDGSWTHYFFNGKPENMVFASAENNSNI